MAYEVRFYLTNPILCGILRYNQETETTGAHIGLGEIPLKVSVIGCDGEEDF